MSRVGLSLDHEVFDEEMLEYATEAILQTRDGKQRFVVPKPIGTPYFINDASMEEVRLFLSQRSLQNQRLISHVPRLLPLQLKSALKTHKELVKGYPRQGAGLEAYVDAGDLGQEPEELLKEKKAAQKVAHVGKEGAKSAASNGAGAVLNGKAHLVEASCCA